MRWRTTGRIWGSLLLVAGVAFATGFEAEEPAGEELPTITFQGEGPVERTAESRRSDGVHLQQAQAQVDIRDFRYFPKKLEIDPNTEVSWTNFDTAEHSATDIGGEFDTGLFPQNETRSVTITDPGTYKYICSIHPEMKASVVVAGGGSGGGGGGGSERDGGGSGTGGIDPDGTGTDDTGTGTTTPSTSDTFPSGTSAANEELPMTGFNVLWAFVLAAVLAAAGLALAALASYLRPY